MIPLFYILVIPFLYFQFHLSLLGAVILTCGTSLYKPPPRYPDLWAVLVSMYSCGHFVCFLIYFHWLQFTAHHSSDQMNITKKGRNQKRD